MFSSCHTFSRVFESAAFDGLTCAMITAVKGGRMPDPKEPPERSIEINPGEIGKEEINLNPAPRPDEAPPTGPEGPERL